MAHNPFLSLEENVSAPVETDTYNPFMVGDSDDIPTSMDGDNPFSASNPFSDFVSYEQSGSNAVPLDIFGVENNYDSSFAQGPVEITTQQNSNMNIFDMPAVDFSESSMTLISKPTNLDLSKGTIEIQSAYSSDEDIQKPKRPPPPARPLPPETQDLILSVTGHMDYTSSHMLDRIPPTRTPSPVSMRDLHSPSPTPDYPFDEGEDTLGEGLMDEDTAPGQHIHTDVMAPSVTNDFFSNEDRSTHMISTTDHNSSVQNDIFNISQNIATPARPARPAPPARPPPPPVPAAPSRTSATSPLPMPVPPPTPAPEVQQSTNVFDDEINLFDPPTPSPPTKPSKEDILSLYAAPRQEKRIDFLSDDISGDEDMTMKEAEIRPSVAIPPIEISILSEADSGKAESPVAKDIMHSTQNVPASEVFAEIPQPVAGDIFNAEHQEEDVGNPFEASTYSVEQNSTPAFGMPNVIPESNVFDMPVTTKVTTSDIPVTATSSSNFDMSASTSEVCAFGTSMPTPEVNAPMVPELFEIDAASAKPVMAIPAPAESPFGNPTEHEEFDAFSQKFDSICNGSSTSGAWGDKTSTADGFGAFGEKPSKDDAFGAFGGSGPDTGSGDGFEAEGDFDASPFLGASGAPPPPSVTPAHFSKEDSQESDDANFSVFIKPKADIFGFGDALSEAAAPSGPAGMPVLAPPPRPAALFSPAPASTDPAAPSPGFDPRVNPFDTAATTQPFEAMEFGSAEQVVEGERGSGPESPATPLFDDDVSMPLEDFPRIQYTGPGWEMQLRQPNKKKITGQRFWKKIFVKLAYQGDNPVVQLYNSPTDKEPFQELPLQACYSVSEVGAQQYDQFGKIFTVKLQYIFYKERPGVRPGQVTKAERITNKLSQFAAYAIQGDYQGVKEFGSDLKKLGLPVEHAPQISQLFKIGSLAYEDVKQFSVCVEEALFRLNAHRDRALVYKMEEVQITAVDELYVEQDAEGSIIKQIARVRLFFLGFLSGMPDIELGVNDMRRQGREVVGRHDIIPVATEEWIRLEICEFHACVQPEEFHATKIIKFKPPDACYIELMRFRVRPPKNRELPLQLKAVMCVTGTKVELRADVLVPGFASRKLGQVPCEDVMIRFPIPECWIYLFRVEKHFRYGSVKSAHKRTGKIKGIERFLGAAAVDTLQESLIEVTSGQAKYEHQHRAIVWRMPRLPKEGQGAYTTHNLVCRMVLTSYDQIPPELAQWAYVEFTMPATQVSHTTVRSVSLQNHDADDPPEKYVRYLARHEYKVGIEHTQGSSTGAYTAAAATAPRAVTVQPQAKPAVPQPPSSDSDSD